MVHYLKTVKVKRTVIDELILSEQTVNIFAGLFSVLILLQLTVPTSQFAALLLRNEITSVLTEMIVVFAFFHRAVAGCGIAGIRCVAETQVEARSPTHFHINPSRVFFMKFPLEIRGIERNVGKYINYTGVLVPLVMSVGHIAENFAQPRLTLSPVYTFMRNQTVGGINEGEFPLMMSASEWGHRKADIVREVA